MFPWLPKHRYSRLLHSLSQRHKGNISNALPINPFLERCFRYFLRCMPRKVLHKLSRLNCMLLPRWLPIRKLHSHSGLTIQSSFDSECYQCPEGTVPNADKDSCEACPPGFTSQVAADACSPCPAGTFSNGVCPGRYI
jgi:hypothetical protein